MGKEKEKIKCTDCGSLKICRDASVMIDQDTGKWELLNVYDKYRWCYECGAEF